MGLAGYNHRFMPDLTSPLTELTRKGVPHLVQWTKQCQAALVQVKRARCGKSQLHSPNFFLPFVLQTDTSNRGLAAVLGASKGADHPVIYISKKLSDPEARYSMVEKECLAICWVVNCLCYYYPLSCPFTICTDHAPLQ